MSEYWEIIMSDKSLKLAISMLADIEETNRTNMNLVPFFNLLDALKDFFNTFYDNLNTDQLSTLATAFAGQQGYDDIYNNICSRIKRKILDAPSGQAEWSENPEFWGEKI